MITPTTTDPTRAILGAWTGLPSHQAEPFLASLRRTGYDGRIVLFVGRTGHMDLRTFASFDVEVVAVLPAVDVLIRDQPFRVDHGQRQQRHQSGADGRAGQPPVP